MYLRSTAVALVGLIKQDVAVLVEYPLRLGTSEDDLEELFEESRCLECELPVVFVETSSTRCLLLSSSKIHRQG